MDYEIVWDVVKNKAPALRIDLERILGLESPPGGKGGKGARLTFCYACGMPRRTRIHIDGLPLHIVQRGHCQWPPKLSH